VKLLLIDGHYYVYRSFFAIPNLSNSRGEPTNAIFGFTKTLRLMIKHLQPELGAVFWDEGMPERRVKLQPAYKETRKEMPSPMVPQLDFIQKLTPLLGFKNISLPNTEADDLMGCYTMAACKRKGMEVVLATNDKDLYQLIGPCVKVYTTAKADLASPKDGFALLGEEQATAKWEVPPKLIGDVLAISGDSVVGAGVAAQSCCASGAAAPPLKVTGRSRKGTLVANPSRKNFDHAVGKSPGGLVARNVSWTSSGPSTFGRPRSAFRISISLRPPNSGRIIGWIDK